MHLIYKFNKRCNEYGNVFICSINKSSIYSIEKEIYDTTKLDLVVICKYIIYYFIIIIIIIFIIIL